jgi:hypothetical protein
MSTNRLVLLIAAVCAVAVLSACGNAALKAEEDRQLALQFAMVALGDDPHDLPPLDEDYDCAIFREDNPALPPVRGRCRWESNRQGDNWLVGFREIWSCRDFASDMPGFPPCDGATGYHEWLYLIDLDGPVQLLGEEGQFAPDMVIRTPGPTPFAPTATPTAAPPDTATP